MSPKKKQKIKNARSVSVRIGMSQLDAIDYHCYENGVDNRSEFVSKCALDQAYLIIAGEAPQYLDVGVNEKEKHTTITVFLYRDEEEVIQEALDRTHHKLSPYLVWATAVVLEKERLKRERRERRQKKKRR